MNVISEEKKRSLNKYPFTECISKKNILKKKAFLESTDISFLQPWVP